MSITETQVRKVARLARLRVTPEELPRMTEEMNGILGWVEQLTAIDTTDVAPMTSGSGQGLRRRPDVVDDGAIAAKVLANAPKATAGFFAVPKVVE